MRSTRRGVRKRTPRFAPVIVSLAVLATACGVQHDAVDVPVTRPTLFPPDYTTAPPTTSTTIDPNAVATTTTKPPRPLPRLVNDGKPRVVVTNTGVVAAVTSVRADGSYVVVTPCGAEAVVAKATPVVAAQVVLDPGHGGTAEPGAVGPTGLREADLNLAVAQYAKSLLESAGLTVVMTRTTDSFMTITSRGRIATSLSPDAFVSIHHNAAPNHYEDRAGTEVYYQADDEQGSKRLAGLIYEEVTKAFASTSINWGWYDDAGVKVRLNDRGTDYYGILRLAAGVPTALAEFAYVSNAPEEALLKTPAFQQLEAGALTRAILRFLTTDDPGTGYVGPSKRQEPATGGGSAGCVDPPMQ